jgi:hypothetical protein
MPFSFKVLKVLAISSCFKIIANELRIGDIAEFEKRLLHFAPAVG